MMVHTLNPSTWEARGRGFSEMQDQPGLQSKFRYNQDYTEKLCLKNKGWKKGRKEGKRKVLLLMYHFVF